MKIFTKEQLKFVMKVILEKESLDRLKEKDINILTYDETKELLNYYLDLNDFYAFKVVFNYIPKNISPIKQKKLLKEFLFRSNHYEHENMASAFQSTFHNDIENISVLLKALKNIPEYLQPEDFKYPYVRKIIYAIGAQPQPESLLALEKLAQETQDKKIKELALHQLEKRKRLGRWEVEKNSLK